MTELPPSARIREVGPRDGFQNEPEVIPTAEKLRLIEMLARSGLRRLEVTSFVRADVIPQLADAEEVLARVERRRRRRLLGPDPERARARAGARASRPLRRGQPLPLRLGDPQPQERQPLDRGVADRPRAGDRARAGRGPALRGRDLDQLRLSLRGRGAARAGARDRRAARRAPAARRSRSATRPGWRTRARSASSSPPRASGSRGVELTAHFHNTRGQGLANVLAALEQGDRLVRVRLRRARRLPGPAGLDRQHLDRGPRLDARGDGGRDGHRPAGG